MARSKTRRIAGWGVVVLTLGVARAQNELFRVTDSAWFGQAVQAAGDVNGDGFVDLLVGRPGSGSATGKIILYSGRDGSVLDTVDGWLAGDKFGAAIIAWDDLTGDGVPEFGASAPRFKAPSGVLGRIGVFDGANRAELWHVDATATENVFGYEMAALDDTNGDGIRDWVVGANYTVVQMRSGSDGSLLHTLTATDYSTDFGTDLAAIDDVDGDGVGDVAVGDPSGGPRYSPRTCSKWVSGGRVFLFSGATGAGIGQLARGSGYYFSGCYGGPNVPDFGRSVSTIADLDGDGVREILVGAPWSLLQGRFYGSSSSIGEVFLYSGASLSLLSQITQYAYPSYFGYASVTFFGDTVQGLDDVNGDGVPDFAVASAWTTRPADHMRTNHLYSGATMSQLYEWEEKYAGPSTVLADADWDGDGVRELVWGGPGPSSSTVSVYDVRRLYLSARPKTVVSGFNAVTLSLAEGTPGTPAAIFLTAVDGHTLLVMVKAGLLDTQGRLTLSGNVPTGSVNSLEFKGFVLDGGKVHQTRREVLQVQ